MKEGSKAPRKEKWAIAQRKEGQTQPVEIRLRWVIGLLLVFLMGQPMEGQTVRQLFQQTLQEFQQAPEESIAASKTVNNFWEKSEPARLFLGVITLYQTFISSQDAPACNFTPSCSRFGQAALSRAGVWKGILLTSDRLQRCNGLPGREGFYPIDHETHRFFDPIDVYLTLTPAKDKGHHEHR
ncbi:MAG: membrane protein insertion efficiency factor YidD [Calditrichaeota bacterium]|nr:membrane protein insertion efficiency factor YidD [Calditrichota bacterium]